MRELQEDRGDEKKTRNSPSKISPKKEVPVLRKKNSKGKVE